MDFRIVIKNAAPKLIGSLEQATFPVYILLLAASPTINGSDLRVGITNRDGEFSFADVAPGKYRIMATEIVDIRLFQSPHILKSMGDIGTEIELRQGETTSIKLSLAGKDAVEQAFVRAGLS